MGDEEGAPVDGAEGEVQDLNPDQFSEEGPVPQAVAEAMAAEPDLSWMDGLDPEEVRQKYEKVSELETAAHQRNRDAQRVRDENEELLQKLGQANQQLQQAQQMQWQQPQYPPQQAYPQPYPQQAPGDYSDEEVDPRLQQLNGAFAQQQQALEQMQNQLGIVLGGKAREDLVSQARSHLPPDEFPHLSKLGTRYQDVVTETANAAINYADQSVSPDTFRSAVRRRLESEEQALAAYARSLQTERLVQKKQAAAGTAPPAAGPARSVRARPKPKNERIDHSKGNADQAVDDRINKILKRHEGSGNPGWGGFG